MGKFFGGPSTTTKTSEKTDMGPSSFQRPYLDQTFGAASSIYNAAKDTPYYQGDTYAGLSDEQKATMANMSSFANQGMGTGQNISSIGSTMANGAAGKAMSNLDRFTSFAGEDATGANMAAAARYADNPYVDGMIDANSRDINRNLYENEIPGIDRAAAGSGNINSSRTGIASGIAQRGAADRIGDISAQIRHDAYSSGLDRAQKDRSTQLDAYGRAAEGYSNLTGQGIDAMQTGTGMGYDALGHQLDMGAMGQTDSQSEMDAAFKAWAGNDERKMDLLARYNSIVGSNAWGQSGTSSGTSTAKTSGGGFGQVLGAAAGIGAAFASKSDRRLKQGTKLLGRLEDGLGVYTYFYRTDNDFNLPTGPQVGVMADEVAELRPHALGPVDRGFASVIYPAL
jgi:hypothetical protein